MSNTNTIPKQIYDLLVSRDFDPKALDAMGKPAGAPADADLFSFDFKTKNHNYGTVVVLVDSDQNVELYYGDNLGKGMEAEDKSLWYDFLYTLRMIAKRNMHTFTLNDMTKLKHNMSTIAAMTEGTLLEGYYGTTKTSYSDQPKKTKLIIKHSRPLGEGEQRFRNIQSLFVETDEGERFKLPFTSLTGGKIMARHIGEGGNPYDAFGQHIVEMMSETATLQRFIRASRSQSFGQDAQALAEQAVEHYAALKRKAKRMIGKRGYKEELENFDPITVSELEETVDAVRDIFVNQTLDARVENALPILAKLKEQDNMKEVNDFENWADSIVEGTWALPDTAEEQNKLKELMASPFPVGADAQNAIEQLYDIIGDDELFDDLGELAEKDPNADARPVIIDAMKRLRIFKSEYAIEATDIDTGKQTVKAERDPMLESEIERIIKLAK